MIDSSSRRHRGPSVLGALILSTIIVTGCSTSADRANASFSGATPSIATPLATSLETADGTWATVPMGHLDQPLNTFWQLFFRPMGAASWSDLVEATAVATNGGLVLASYGGPNLDVGIRPSNDLRFSPLISTADAGRSWSNGLLTTGLAARPDALAADASGRVLALVQSGMGQAVLASTGDLSHWRTLTSEGALASSPPGRSCGLGSITAVGLDASNPLIGGACRQPGVVGLFTQRGGAWHLTGPTLPSSLGRASVEVLAVEMTSGGTSAILGIADRDGTSLVAAWADGDGQWTSSPALRIASSERVASVGPAPPRGLFVLLSAPSGPENLTMISRSSSGWRMLAPPPAGTATVASGPGATVDALVVNDTVLTVWTLSPPSATWTRGQAIDVPIQFGSSG